MSNLHLILEKKYFKPILDGRKKEEFRTDSKFYRSRLLNKDGSFKNYKTVTFQGGYHKNALKMVIEIKEITYNGLFVIHLGKCLESNFDTENYIKETPDYKNAESYDIGFFDSYKATSFTYIIK